MNKAINIFVAFVILGLGGCATLPPPQPLDSARAVIGISVKTRQPIKVVSHKPQMMYFIKVDKEEDLYTQGNFIRSDYSKGGQVYLLNAEPGRYAAVGCYMKGGGIKWVEYTTFFPEELIKLTEVAVAPGTIAFMGEYVVDQSVGLKDADDCQLHYLQLIAPGALTGPIESGVLAAILGHGDYYYKGSIHEEHCDREAEIRFLTTALEHFKDTGWVNIVERRLEELKSEK